MWLTRDHAFTEFTGLSRWPVWGSSEMCCGSTHTRVIHHGVTENNRGTSSIRGADIVEVNIKKYQYFF